jgi:hypothetical protein
MSAYINLLTGAYPRHEGDIRLEHPEILESQTGDAFPCPDTYAKVHWADMPEYDPATQVCYETAPVLDDGVWKMSWHVRPRMAEE